MIQTLRKLWQIHGGLHLDYHKEASNNAHARYVPLAAEFIIPLQQHAGYKPTLTAKVGDYVYKGQELASHTGFMKVPVHASTSGTITAIEERPIAHPSGLKDLCLILTPDGKDDWGNARMSPYPDPQQIDPETLRKRICAAGIVGMGGATFPTHVKYAPQSSGRIIDTVILNGIECEPFITADYRILIEHADEVIRGLKYFLKASLANKGIIAIEDNKPRAIELFNQLTADDPNISVVVCPEKYPQGSERHLIYAVTGRVVPERALPSAVGVIVDNVATAMQAALAVKDDLPCYERIVTVSGNAVHKPGNYRVRIGTLYSHLVEQGAQGLKNDPARIISGGPMMGFSLHSLDFPVLKGTGGLLHFDHQSELAKLPPENPCVRCGKCVDTCPMFLEPTQLFKAVKRRDWPAALAGHVGTCIECGSCAYNCPAHIPLVQYIRMGKQFILTDGFGGHNPYYKK